MVNASYAVAMANGTVTLEVALRALSDHSVERSGLSVNRWVPTTPLTMSATSLAILAAGLRPSYLDVDPETWLLADPVVYQGFEGTSVLTLPVSLYGLPSACSSQDIHPRNISHWIVDDAAQTLRTHDPKYAFTSYSFQRSKILSTGEGGMLVTNEPKLAELARSIASLGYDLTAKDFRVNTKYIKGYGAVRHVRYGLNARMNDATARVGLDGLAHVDTLRAVRRASAAAYLSVLAGVDWLQLQGGVTDATGALSATHSVWALALAAENSVQAAQIATAVTRHGGERPYAAWRLAYREPALEQLLPAGHPGCPVAEDLQRRILQFQTNDLASAEKNAEALRLAIAEIGGSR